VESALRGIFQEVDKRRLNSLALPFIGTLHGKLRKEQFVGMLREVLAYMEFKHLRKVWLVVPSKTKRAILKALEPGFQKGG
jgi:O-acetyl-ADP-ribose deacetylase (regulator of RNase III)